MARPVVLIDGMVFENAIQAGIWRIFYEVISRTSQSVDYKLLLDSKAVQPIPNGVEVIRSMHRTQISWKRQLVRRVGRQLALRKICRRFPYAIWHSSYFSPDPRKEGKSVVSIYDMIAEERFLAYPVLEDQIQRKRACVEQAQAVLAISNETKRLAQKHFPFLAENVTVTSLGCEHLKQRPGSGERILREDGEFVLFVGNRNYYKNFECLVHAVASAQWPEGLNVVVAGKPMSENEREFLRVNNVLDRFKQVGFVADDELGALMRAANSFVFPSVAEGFGLPTVEAQLNSCPAIVSDLPVFHEVAGDGAVYFNPMDAESLAASVRAVYVSIDRGKLIELGQRNARRFSWDETASVTQRCYEELWSS